MSQEETYNSTEIGFESPVDDLQCRTKLDEPLLQSTADNKVAEDRDTFNGEDTTIQEQPREVFKSP